MITLNQYLKKNNENNNLSELILLISRQANHIRRAFFDNRHFENSFNIHGDRQIALDKWADKHLISALEKSDLVRTIASEEQSEIVEIMKSKGEFGIVMDPLDGSSLVPVNLTVGTIVGIYDSKDVLQKGKNLAVALYILYGPLTILVCAINNQVNEFVLNQDNFFVLQKENIKIPEGNLYCPGGMRADYLNHHKKYIEELEKEKYKLRYSGAFVADFHQILTYGGVFSYPALSNYKYGKLRLVFEVNPIGYIAQIAGGRISNGNQNILDIKPEALDQRVPVYIGSKNRIEKIEQNQF